MKKYLLLTLCLIPAVTLLSPCWAQTAQYKDGVYKGKSQSRYTDEPYWGKVTITVKDGRITSIDFAVIDSAKNELFDDRYERYFTGNENYIQQCRNDRKGIEVYPKMVLEKQKIDDVDAISGATWSFSLLKGAMADALRKAKK